MVHHAFCCRKKKHKESLPNADNNVIDDPESTYTYIDTANLHTAINALDNKQLSRPKQYIDVLPDFQNGINDGSNNVRNAKPVIYDNIDLPDKSDESKQSRKIAVSNGDGSPMYNEIPEQAERTDKYLQTVPSGDKGKVDNNYDYPGYADMDDAATAFGASNQNVKDAETKTSNENATKEEAIPQYATVNKPKSDDREIVENELHVIRAQKTNRCSYV